MAMITEVTFRPYRLYLEKPLEVNGVTLERRRGLLMWLHFDDDRWGVGDIALWPGLSGPFLTLQAFLPALGEMLVGKDPDTLLDFGLGTLPQAGMLWSEVIFALESALLDWRGQHTEKMVAQLLAKKPTRGALSEVVVGNSTEARGARDAGMAAVRYLAGNKPAEDDMRVIAAIRGAVGNEVAMRIEATGMLAQAVPSIKTLSRIAALQPQYVLHPYLGRDLAKIKTIRTQGLAPVAIDAAQCTAEVLEDLINFHGVDALIIRPIFCGGLMAAQRLAHRAIEAGLIAVISHTLESAVGRMATRHLAVSLDGPRTPHQLVDCLDPDLAATPISAGGVWPVIPGKHFGLEIGAAFSPITK